MRNRSEVFACAVFLLSPVVARADAGLPRLSTPDWSSLSTPQWAGVGLALALTTGWLGLWAFKRPFAALGSLLWLVGLPFLLIGAYAIVVAVGLRAYAALPCAVVGLGLGAGSAFGGYRVMNANGAWSGRAVLPGLVGLFVLILILWFTGSALRWIEPPSLRPPDADRPAPRPAGNTSDR